MEVVYVTFTERLPVAARSAQVTKLCCHRLTYRTVDRQIYWQWFPASFTGVIVRRHLVVEEGSPRTIPRGW